MGWSKFDDAYPHHPKIIEAGEAALALDVCGICYSAKHETDGFIGDAALNLLGPVKNPKRAAAALVGVGRWERDDDRKGWVIHDYLDYNPSARSREEEREAARERMANARKNKGRTSESIQTNNGRSSDNPVPDPTPPGPGLGDESQSPRSKNPTDLVARLNLSCRNPNTQEAARVVQMLREHVDDGLIERCVGWTQDLPLKERPRRPAYFLTTIADWGRKEGVVVPELRLVGAS